MSKSLLLSGVASVAAVSTAMAGDLPAKKVAPAAPVASAPAYSWTGISIGIGGGASMLQAQDYVNSNVYASDYEGYIDSGYVAQNDLGKFGAFGTIQIAADYQAGSVVFGAFADYDLGSVKADAYHNSYCNYYSYGVNGPSGCNSIRTSSVEISNSWDVGGRLGVVVNERALVYALGGYSVAKIKTGAYHNVYDDSSYGSSDYYNYVDVEDEHTKGGWLVGAGLEYAISSNLSLKTEYRYVNYGKVSDENDSGPRILSLGPSVFIDHSADVTTQSVRALLSYKF